MFENVRVDIKRYMVTEEVKSISGIIELFLFDYSLWYILSYRFGRWVRQEFKIPIVKQILKIVTRFLHEFLTLVTGICFSFDTSIGPGFYIGHTGTTIINSHTVIGSHCSISTGVIIGQGGRGEQIGWPIIGNYVYIAPGAKVFGKIIVGDHVAIGANAVVNKDIPENATVVGIPAKLINYKGSGDFIRAI